MMVYHTEFYDEVRGDTQWIRLGEGCPNSCEYCQAPKEMISYDIPIIRRNKVGIMDMNFLAGPEVESRMVELGSRRADGKVVHYELLCGIDWRRMTQERANLLKQNRFVKLRFAWDLSLECQYKIKDCLKMLKKAGYDSQDLMVFVLADWKISFNECLAKLFLLKSWNVKVSDCYFDNATPPDYQMNYWTFQECKVFRSLCALHNQSVRFGIYPDLARVRRSFKLLNDLKAQQNLNEVISCKC